MKIFSVAQIKNWEAYTIQHQTITPLNLMELAAGKCVQWLAHRHYQKKHFKIFCGKGNNGADGLVIARLLIEKDYAVSVYILEFGKIGTEEFQINLAKLHECSTDIHFIQSTDFFPKIKNTDIIIDAIFGIGLNKPLDEIAAALVNYINNSNASIIAIDIPSGLFADNSSTGHNIIKARHTLSFQNYKLAFLLPQNEDYCGRIHLLNIGLHKQFEEEEPAPFELVNLQKIKTIYAPRKKFSHKGNFGHAALLCGSYGMMGAAVLSAKACLKTGVGKTTCYIPKCGYTILQTSVPEAICVIAGEEFILEAKDIEKFDSVAMGCGIGLHATHTNLLLQIFGKINKPLVLDADALNIIAENKILLDSIPPLSIITPHFKEFERLFGKPKNDTDRLQLALQKSKEHNIYIVLKGHFTFISTPQGNGFFNSTGNAGMATAGSGDVLSGVLVSLLAQGYNPLQACILGVYLHGRAGDFAAEKLSQEAMLSGDIIEFLGESFKSFQ